MARPDDFDVHKVIESLQGTCGTLEGTIRDFYPDMSEMDLMSEDYNTIDNEIFECQTCNWWCEISQVCSKDCCSDNAENHCEDCCEEEEEN